MTEKIKRRIREGEERRKREKEREEGREREREGKAAVKTHRDEVVFQVRAKL